MVFIEEVTFSSQLYKCVLQVCLTLKILFTATLHPSLSFGLINYNTLGNALKLMFVVLFNVRLQFSYNLLLFEFLIRHGLCGNVYSLEFVLYVQTFFNFFDNFVSFRFIFCFQGNLLKLREKSLT